MIITVEAIISFPPLEIMVIKLARHLSKMIEDGVIKKTKKNSHQGSKIKVVEETLLITMDQGVVTRVLMEITRKVAIETPEIEITVTAVETTENKISSQSRWFQTTNSNMML